MIKTYRALNYKQMGVRRRGAGGRFEFARDLSPQKLTALGFSQQYRRWLFKQQNIKKQQPLKHNFCLIDSTIWEEPERKILVYRHNLKSWPLLMGPGHPQWRREKAPGTTLHVYHSSERSRESKADHTGPEQSRLRGRILPKTDRHLLGCRLVLVTHQTPSLIPSSWNLSLQVLLCTVKR